AILLAITFGSNHTIYHWTDAAHVEHDKILNFKKGFLNKNFFTVATILTIGLWSFLGWKMRKLSRSIDDSPIRSKEAGKKYTWTSTVWAAIYLVVFALTVMSSIPWLWLMSIDAHWYSTMSSWYTFGSTFVSGLALLPLFVIFLKNNNYLEIVTKEHIQDLGKFLFAFSIFWTYLWFSQVMLIWYANIPEETVYFKPRAEGPYSGIFWMMLIINFLAPLLILMRAGSKRNYTTMVFMTMLLIFGHWLNFYQMVFPSPMTDADGATHVPMIVADFGVALGFVGLITVLTAKALTKAPLVPRNHPFLKETIIHHV